MISTKKVNKDGMFLYKIILFKIFTLGVTSDNTFGKMYSIFFGIYMYELHIQFRKWVIQKPTIVNTGNKVDA
jgi:hypothetical protein